MTQSIRERLLLTAQIGILVAQIVALGFAAIASTQASTIALSADRQDAIDSDSAYRDEVQARARIVAWQTRFETMNDLDVKLKATPGGAERLAGEITDHSG